MTDDIDSSNIEKALRPKYRTTGKEPLTLLMPSSVAPVGSVAYLGANDPKVPRWGEFMESFYSGANQARNQSSRMVIFLPVRGRVFAACFGYGSSVLEWDVVESGFGLRVAARLLSPNDLTEMRSRRVDPSARTQSISVVGGSEIRELGGDLEGEFVRKLVGRLEESEIEIFSQNGFGNRALIASDSIAFNSEVDLTKVVGVLEEMLSKVETEDTQEEFEFIDSLVPLRTSEEAVSDLQRLLAASLLERPDDRPNSTTDLDVHFIDFAAPDDISVDDADGFRIFRGERSEYIEVPTLAALREALRSIGVSRGTTFLNNTRIVALSASGQEQSQALPLRNWLIFEAGNNVSRFILTLGRWFKLDEDYTLKLNNDIMAITDFTNQLNLVDWMVADHEDVYNTKASNSDPELINLDKKLVLADDGDRVESCDLLHVRGLLIHVKRYTGSQTLSHLFSQGVVSAELLNADVKFKENFIDLVESVDVSFKATAQAPPRDVVYAIGVGDGRQIPSGLPTFSKVNLRGHARTLRVAGFNPGVARIVIV